MRIIRIEMLPLLSFFVGLVTSQTFSDLALPPSIIYTSDACKQALGSVIDCPAVLVQLSTSIVALDNSTLVDLCSDSCISSLVSAQSSIRQSCTSYFDYIIDEAVVWPASYIVDKFLLAADLVCLRDASSNDFCYNILSEWEQDPSGVPGNTGDISCSSCVLGQAQIQLDSPLRYSDNLASAFSSATSSCGASQYSYTSPAAYALNTVAPISIPNNTVACVSSYTVQAGDTCTSISQSQNVSTDSLRRANGILNYCDGLPAVGGTLCIPQACTTYVVGPDDSCTSIAAASNISGVQFLSWNPVLNNMCGNFDDILGDTVCTSQPGSAPPCAQMTVTGTATGTAMTTATAVPTNADSNSNTNCGAWYTVQSGDYCKSISLAQSISLQDFYFLNPDINSDCTNLYLGLAYCIAPVGSISTYSGYPTTTPYITLTPTSYATATDDTLPTWTLPPVTVQSQFPIAPDSLSGCVAYQNYIDPAAIKPNYIDVMTNPNASVPELINDCEYVASSYDVNITQLMDWNPSLGNNYTNCSLEAGYSYCALRNVTDQQPYIPDCAFWNATVAGTTTQCDCYATVYGSNQGEYDCTDMATDWNTTISSILSYNSWLGSDCDGNLYANLGADSLRTICVAIDPSLPVGSSS